MLRKIRNGLVWWEFELLQPFPVVHAIFTRKGGVSKFPFDSLNLDDASGDEPAAVQENRRLAAEAIGSPELFFLRQRHSSDVAIIQEPVSGLSVDGVITGKKHLPLSIVHGDCQAAIFYDTKHHVIANVHAGWRGNVQNIYAKTIETMKKWAKTEVQDLIVCISPSLGPTAAEFIHYPKELPEHFWVHKDEKDHFNFWNITYDQLRAVGITHDQIEIASICTYREKEEFFSYRRDKTTGRNATVCFLT